MEALKLFLDNFADWDSFVRIWPLLWQGLLWWLRGRGWQTALGAGLLAAAAAFAGNPLLAAVAGVAAAVSGLVALSDSAESGAAALSEAVQP